jgi:hypothetical protein
MIVDDGISAGEPGEAVRPGLFSRRAFLVGSAAGLGTLALGGCSGAGMSIAEAERVYGPVPEERFPIPAVNVRKVDPTY